MLCVLIADSTCDITIDPNNTNQYIVWGVGGLGETAFKHFIRANCMFVFIVYEDVLLYVCISIVGDDPIHLGRAPEDQCNNTQLASQSCNSVEGTLYCFLSSYLYM